MSAAADGGCEPMPGSAVLDYSGRYPGAAERHAFAEAYLRAREQQQAGRSSCSTMAATRELQDGAGEGSGGEGSVEARAEALAAAADRYAAASHLLWGLWGVLQAQRWREGGAAAPFDYAAYGEARFRAFVAHSARLGLPGACAMKPGTPPQGAAGALDGASSGRDLFNLA